MPPGQPWATPRDSCSFRRNGSGLRVQGEITPCNRLLGQCLDQLQMQRRELGCAVMDRIPQASRPYAPIAGAFHPATSRPRLRRGAERCASSSAFTACGVVLPSRSQWRASHSRRCEESVIWCVSHQSSIHRVLHLRGMAVRSNPRMRDQQAGPVAAFRRFICGSSRFAAARCI